MHADEHSDQDVGTLERRRNYRVECNLPLQFVVPATGQAGDGSVTNIGLGGLRADLGQEVNLPAELELTIGFPSSPHEESSPFTARARVVWTVNDRAQGPFPAGLQFGKLDDATRRRLYELVGSLMR